MGDIIFGYVQMANAAPVAKFTDADAGQITVMDDITAAGDVVAVIVNNNPRMVEFSSPTVEVGKSYIAYEATSSPIIDRILFESTEGRMAFVENILAVISDGTPALGIPVQPEMIWRDDKFQPAIQENRDAIIEIENAPDVLVRTMLKTPSIKFVKSPTVRVNETVIWINFPEAAETIKVHLVSSLNNISFIRHFISPLAASTAIRST